nr:hypothetical protein [Sphingomonas sp. TX0522]
MGAVRIVYNDVAIVFVRVIGSKWTGAGHIDRRDHVIVRRCGIQRERRGV